MLRIVIISFISQLEDVKHQPTQEHAQKQDEQQVQPMGDEPMNAPNPNAIQRG